MYFNEFITRGLYHKGFQAEYYTTFHTSSKTQINEKMKMCKCENLPVDTYWAGDLYFIQKLTGYLDQTEISQILFGRFYSVASCA